MYTLIVRVLDGQETVGYQVKNEKGRILTVSKKWVLETAKRNLIVNANYNKYTDSLIGKNNVNLRSLPSVQVKKNETIGKSNHEQAKKYANEQEKKGKWVLKFELLPDDKVVLKRINPEITGTVLIPSFITDIDFKFYKNFKDVGSYSEDESILESYFDFSGKSDVCSIGCSSGTDIKSLISLYSEKKGGLGPSLNCNYTELLIDNKVNQPFNASGLCLGLNSENLEIEFRHPENVIDLSYAFAACFNLKNLHIKSIKSFKENKSLKGLLFGDKNLSSVNIEQMNTESVIDMSGLFFGLMMPNNNLNLSLWKTSNVKYMNWMFAYSHFKNINLNSIDTQNVINFMGFGFDLETNELNLTGISFKSVKNMDSMLHVKNKVKIKGNLDYSRFKKGGTLYCSADTLSGCSLDIVDLPEGFDMEHLAFADECPSYESLFNFVNHIENIKVRANTIFDAVLANEEMLGASEGDWIFRDIISEFEIVNSEVSIDLQKYQRIFKNPDKFIAYITFVGTEKLILPIDFLSFIKKSLIIKAIKEDKFKDKFMQVYFRCKNGKLIPLNKIKTVLDIKEPVYSLYDQDLNRVVLFSKDGELQTFVSLDDLNKLLDSKLIINDYQYGNLPVVKNSYSFDNNLPNILGVVLQNSSPNQIASILSINICESKKNMSKENLDLIGVISEMSVGDKKVIKINGRKIGITVLE